ncbi:DUF1488 family protein [Bordetella genomosp. 6]|uniref:DUF1488 family protein n=1 Tax=Bordetella genomosp. 6 TaxID=463024 RepID=UPI000A2912A3|nr:DUF1488 family protein [Bordetella genomosp. 6]ARP78036.1 hypothetical protein CAL11_18740 [Bordetella genomosp. 6]
MKRDDNATVDGACVRFTLQSPHGPTVVAVTAKALVEHCGADNSGPGLLQGYRAHWPRIHAVARQLAPSTLDGGVRVTASDLADARSPLMSDSKDHGAAPARKPARIAGQPDVDSAAPRPAGKPAGAKRR